VAQAIKWMLEQVTFSLTARFVKLLGWSILDMVAPTLDRHSVVHLILKWPQWQSPITPKEVCFVAKRVQIRALFVLLEHSRIHLEVEHAAPVRLVLSILLLVWAFVLLVQLDTSQTLHLLLLAMHVHLVSILVLECRLALLAVLVFIPVQTHLLVSPVLLDTFQAVLLPLAARALLETFPAPMHHLAVPVQLVTTLLQLPQVVPLVGRELFRIPLVHHFAWIAMWDNFRTRRQEPLVSVVALDCTLPLLETLFAHRVLQGYLEIVRVQVFALIVLLGNTRTSVPCPFVLIVLQESSVPKLGWVLAQTALLDSFSVLLVLQLVLRVLQDTSVIRQRRLLVTRVPVEL
jgi:hypothetical protein